MSEKRKKELEKKYEVFLDTHGLCATNRIGMYQVIGRGIQNFCSRCRNPAIWCDGRHTDVLMADFIYEIKNVSIIVDKKINKSKSGYRIIPKERIREEGIDGIIISSYKFKDEISDIIEKDYPDIPYHDIYEDLRKNGFELHSAYFSIDHPYERYQRINKLRKQVRLSDCDEKIKDTLISIIEEFVLMKDFVNACKYAAELRSRYKAAEYQRLYDELFEIYMLECDAAEKIDENNVLMFCFDGLREEDVEKGVMPEFRSYLVDHAQMYENAYSVSTSTFESLLPCYGEISDIKSDYSSGKELQYGRCRFINRAHQQNRKILFYTDLDRFVSDDDIKMVGYAQSTSEKIWNFIVDATDEQNGLFYIHINYETHFSYPSPYSSDEDVVFEGTNVMFDDIKGEVGKYKSDYRLRHMEALRYVDDVTMPFIKLLKCRMVFFADHGNIIPSMYEVVGELDELKYSAADELIHIPFSIISPEYIRGIKTNLISQRELNSVVCSLMDRSCYVFPDAQFVKIQRTEIYNPDFKHIYSKYGHQTELLAFEGFITRDGYKILIFSDGTVKLYRTVDDVRVYDEEEYSRIISLVKESITVCDVSELKFGQ